MTTIPAPGLIGDSFIGWLAAVGVIVLIPEAKLRWTEDLSPHAEFFFDGPEEMFYERVGEELSERTRAGLLSISALGDSQKPTFSTYGDAAEMARSSSRDGSLGSLVSDLLSPSDFRTGQVRRESGVELPCSAVLTGAPGKMPWSKRVTDMGERLREIMSEDAGAVFSSLAGKGKRTTKMGTNLNTDRYRNCVLPLGAKGALTVDVVAETLSFFGVWLLAFRGGYKDRRMRLSDPRGERRRFGILVEWPCWGEPLELWGIDALLDLSVDEHLAAGRRVVVADRVAGLGNDKTRAYAKVPSV